MNQQQQTISNYSNYSNYSNQSNYSNYSNYKHQKNQSNQDQQKLIQNKNQVQTQTNGYPSESDKVQSLSMNDKHNQNQNQNEVKHNQNLFSQLSFSEQSQKSFSTLDGDIYFDKAITLYDKIIQIAKQAQQTQQKRQKKINQNKKKLQQQQQAMLQRLQSQRQCQRYSYSQIEKLIQEYQSLSFEKNSSSSHKRGLRLMKDQFKLASQILTKIIEKNNQSQRIQQKAYYKSIYHRWNFQQNFDCELSQAWRNYQIFNRRDERNDKIQNLNTQTEKEFKQLYLNHIKNRHLNILKILEENSYNQKLPTYQRVKTNSFNQFEIQIQMEKGLIIPLLDSYEQFQFQIDAYIGYRMFFDLLPIHIKLKFILQIGQCLRQLNKLGIQHNDVKIDSVIYSIKDNRFKLYDFESAKYLQKQKNNFNVSQHLSFFDLINQDQYQAYLQKIEYFSEDKNNQNLFKNIINKRLGQSNLEYSLSLLKSMIKNPKRMNQLKYKFLGRTDVQMYCQMVLKLFLKDHNLKKVIDKENQQNQIEIESPDDFYNLSDIIIGLRKGNIKLRDLQQKNGNQQRVFFEIFSTMLELLRNKWKKKSSWCWSYSFSNFQTFIQFLQQQRNETNQSHFLEEIDCQKKENNSFSLISQAQISFNNSNNSQAYKIFNDLNNCSDFKELNKEDYKSIDKIGESFRIKADYVQQQDQLKDLLKFIKATFGEDSEQYKEELEKLEKGYFKNGDYQNAKKYYQKIEDKIINKNGQKSKQYADWLDNMGSVYNNKGEFDDALKYYFSSLQIRKIVLGQMHSDYATSLNNIGQAYNNKGYLDRALEYYFKSLQITKKVLGQMHPAYATSLNNIGLNYTNKGDLDKALQYYFKSLQIRKTVLGQMHPDFATSLNNIGLNYANRGDLDKALEYYFKSLQIIKTVLGQMHPDYATSLNNIGLTYTNKGHLDKALEYYFKSLQIRKTVLGQMHPDYATSLNNIVQAYNNKGDLDMALEYYFKSLQIKQVVFGQMHLQNSSSLYNISSEQHKYPKKQRFTPFNRKYMQFYDKIIRFSLQQSPQLKSTQQKINNQNLNKEMNLQFYHSERIKIYKTLIGQYQKLCQCCCPIDIQQPISTSKILPNRILSKDFQTAVSLFLKIFYYRSEYPNVYTQKTKLIWDCQQNLQQQSFKVFCNYQIYNKKQNKQKKFSQSQDQFQKKYLQYIFQKHKNILQRIQKFQNVILPYYEKIQVQEKYKLSITMQKGLIFPLIQILDYQTDEYIGYNKFFSLLPKNIQLKFVKQIAENIKCLNSLGIQHNSIRFMNVIYSIKDDRFKLINYDFSYILGVKRIINSFSFQFQSHLDHQNNVSNFSQQQLAKVKLKQLNDLIFKSNQQSFIQYSSNQILEMISNQKNYKEFRIDHFGQADMIMYSCMLLKLFCNLQSQSKSQKNNRIRPNKQFEILQSPTNILHQLIDKIKSNQFQFQLKLKENKFQFQFQFQLLKYFNGNVLNWKIIQKLFKIILKSKSDYKQQQFQIKIEVKGKGHQKNYKQCQDKYKYQEQKHQRQYQYIDSDFFIFQRQELCQSCQSQSMNNNLIPTSVKSKNCNNMNEDIDVDVDVNVDQDETIFFQQQRQSSLPNSQEKLSIFKSSRLQSYQHQDFQKSSIQDIKDLRKDAFKYQYIHLYDKVINICTKALNTMELMNMKNQCAQVQVLVKVQSQFIQSIEEMIQKYQQMVTMTSKQKANEFVLSRTISLKQMNYGQATQAMQILAKIVQNRQKSQIYSEQKIRLIWKCDQNMKFQNFQYYQNYQIFNEKFGIKGKYESYQKFINAYKLYAIQKHSFILKMIKQSNSQILPKIYSISENYKEKYIKIQMQRGLVFPMINQDKQYDYNFQDIIKGDTAFFPLLNDRLKFKLLKQISQSLYKLNCLGIQHCDITMRNMIYSITDNRFKLIDFDLSSSVNFQSKTKDEVNFSYLQTFNLNLLKQQQIYQQLENEDSFNFDFQKVLEQKHHSCISYNQILNLPKELRMIKQNSFVIQKMVQNPQKFYQYKKIRFGIADVKMFAILFLKFVFHLKIKKKQNQKRLFQEFLYKFQKRNFNYSYFQFQYQQQKKYYFLQQTEMLLNIIKKMLRKSQFQIQMYKNTQIQSLLIDQNNSQIKNKSQIKINSKLSQQNLIKFKQSQQVQIINLERVLKFEERSFGKIKYQSFKYLKILIQKYCKVYTYKKALSTSLQLKKLLKFQNKQITQEYAYVQDKIGSIYMLMKKYDLAEAFFIKSLNIRKNIFGQSHILIVDSLNNIGKTYIKRQLYIEAQEYFCKSIQISQKNAVFDNDFKLKYVESLKYLGDIYLCSHEYTKAQQKYLKNLKLLKELFGQDNFNTVQTLKSLGKLYFDFKKFKESQEYYLKSLSIFKNASEINNLEYALILKSIGEVMKQTKQNKKALKYFVQAEKIFQILHRFKQETSIQEYLQTLKLIFQLLVQQQNLIDSLQYQNKYLKLCKPKQKQKKTLQFQILKKMKIQKKQYNKAILKKIDVSAFQSLANPYIIILKNMTCINQSLFKALRHEVKYLTVNFLITLLKIRILQVFGQSLQDLMIDQDLKNAQFLNNFYYSSLKKLKQFNKRQNQHILNFDSFLGNLEHYTIFLIEISKKLQNQEKISQEIVINQFLTFLKANIFQRSIILFVQGKIKQNFKELVFQNIKNKSLLKKILTEEAIKFLIQWIVLNFLLINIAPSSALINFGEDIQQKIKEKVKIMVEDKEVFLLQQLSNLSQKKLMDLFCSLIIKCVQIQKQFKKYRKVDNYPNFFGIFIRDLLILQLNQGIQLQKRYLTKQLRKVLEILIKHSKYQTKKITNTKD